LIPDDECTELNVALDMVIAVVVVVMAVVAASLVLKTTF
jgi:hypothetical protein